MNWIVMPVLAGPEMTETAIADCLAQTVPTKVLVVNQGVDDAFRDRLERIAEADDRVLVWHHQPPLLSLSATWNRALRFVWESGGEEALVVNNDVRLSPYTVKVLQEVRARTEALFVTCVGVRAEQFLNPPYDTIDLQKLWEELPAQRGGPDFSCFLISQGCHWKYDFDERFIPAFCEDLDYHRRLMLGGDGQKIFSVNLPYLHLASQTLKQIDPDRAERIKAQIESMSRAHYAAKWGGPVNQETFFTPFADQRLPAPYERVPPKHLIGCGPTTPEIQAWVQADARNPPLDELAKRMLEK